MKVAVDAMGGDRAPGETVAGAVMAAREGGVDAILVGDPGTIQSELARHETDGLPIGIVPAEGVIEEGEAPALALRQKPKASIVVATGLIKAGQADAAVSMGSTGAAMAAGAVILGVIEGIGRPALGGPIIGLAPHTAVIDLGTNVDCRPIQLLSFAVIGGVWARLFWDIESPRVALLSVGAETGKGNRQIREAAEVFAKSGLNYIGNVEANDLLLNKAEVVVCDGFVGNIVMKLTEGLGLAITEHLRAKFGDRWPGEALEEITTEIFQQTNQLETYGGGPLLGVNGVSVVGHGRGNADAVRRAIGTAKRSVENGFISRINDELDRMREQVGETQG